jgi:hypothetical protein
MEHYSPSANGGRTPVINHPQNQKKKKEAELQEEKKHMARLQHQPGLGHDPLGLALGRFGRDRNGRIPRRFEKRPSWKLGWSGWPRRDKDV